MSYLVQLRNTLENLMGSSLGHRHSAETQTNKPSDKEQQYVKYSI